MFLVLTVETIGLNGCSGIKFSIGKSDVILFAFILTEYSSKWNARFNMSLLDVLYENDTGFILIFGLFSCTVNCWV